MSKMTIKDLVDALVGKHGLSRRDAETFISTFFDVVTYGLDNEKAVKVRGLGTFKVVGVKERESVNVNTGERVTIDSHSKIAFTPEPIMRDLVNKPFAQFETVVLNDGIDLDELEKAGTDLMGETEGESETPTSNLDIQETSEEAITKDEIQPEESVSSEDVEPFGVDDAPENADSSEEVPVYDVSQSEVEDSYDRPESDGRGIPLDVSESENEEPEVDVVVHDSHPNVEGDLHENTAIQAEERDTEEPTEKQETVSLEQDDVPLENNEESHVDRVEDKDEQSEALIPGAKSHGVWRKFVFPILLVAVMALILVLGYYWGRSYAPVPVTKTIVHKVVVRAPKVSAALQDTLSKDSASAISRVDSAKINKNNMSSPEREETHLQEKSDNFELNNARAIVRTGAYRIIGTERTVTVKRGQSLTGLSKFYLGDGMESYVQVHNGITDVKEGMRIKIPKLALKRKK